MNDSEINDFPVAVFEDRYSGAYSGGSWVAIANAAMVHETGCTRAQFCLTSDIGPFGTDVDAGMFWSKAPKWIAVGSSPEEAIQKLRNRVLPNSDYPIASAIKVSC